MPSLPAALVSRPAPSQSEPSRVPPLSPASSIDSTAPSRRLIRSRRRRYLELHPSYYASASADLELAEPLTYDRLVRRHQSAAEREAAGRSKSLADALTGSLLRGEASSGSARRRLAAGATDGNGTSPSEGHGNEQLDWTVEGEELDEPAERSEAEVPEHEARLSVDPREQGMRAWRKRLEERFVAGGNKDFEYGEVDGDDRLDEGAGSVTTEEQWFEEESEDDDHDGTRQLQGQTGKQDF